MQKRVCGAFAAMSLENMILCRAAEEAQVSRDAPPVSMVNLLVGSLTEELALREAPASLVIRVRCGLQTESTTTRLEVKWRVTVGQGLLK